MCVIRPESAASRCASRSRSGEHISPDRVRATIEMARGDWRLFRRLTLGPLVPSRAGRAVKRWFLESHANAVSPEVLALYMQERPTVDVTALLPDVDAPVLVLIRPGVDRTPPPSAGPSRRPFRTPALWSWGATS